MPGFSALVRTFCAKPGNKVFSCIKMKFGRNYLEKYFASYHPNPIFRGYFGLFLILFINKISIKLLPTYVLWHSTAENTRTHAVEFLLPHLFCEIFIIKVNIKIKIQNITLSFSNFTIFSPNYNQNIKIK